MSALQSPVPTTLEESKMRTAGTHVTHLHFDGLRFRHTTFTLGHIEARVATDTAIMFENTSDSSVRNCHFENMGGYALWLHLESQRNVFDQNTVRYSGGGGVLLTGARPGYMGDSKIYTPGEAAAKVAPILNRITRNTVEHCGRMRYYGGGVHLDSRPLSMTMAPGNSERVITPPFVKEVGPGGTATYGIDMETNKLTGSIISHTETANFSQTGTWKKETATGIVNLFEFEFLAGTAAVPS